MLFPRRAKEWLSDTISTTRMTAKIKAATYMVDRLPVAVSEAGSPVAQTQMMTKIESAEGDQDRKKAEYETFKFL
jgi:hypothetical protein